MNIFKILFVLFGTYLSGCYALPPASFTQSKKMAKLIFVAQRKTLYCQCTYDSRHNVDLASCGMDNAIKHKRAQRVEWEHMMPAENFGRHFECWRKPICEKKGKLFKGRRCCKKIDGRFRRLEGELYNLWPSVGLVNQARSNYRYGIVENNRSFYGCAFKVDKRLRKVEPASYAKGIVARANLFVSQHYDIRLSPSQRMLFEAWNKQYPPTGRHFTVRAFRGHFR